MKNLDSTLRNQVNTELLRVSSKQGHKNEKQWISHKLWELVATSEVRGSSQEELPHVRGQGRWPGGATPRTRNSGCMGAGGPRGAIPRQGQEGQQWAISNPERWYCESAVLNMPANLENSAVATGLEKVSFHSNPKERQCQRMLKLPHNCTHLTH